MDFAFPWPMSDGEWLAWSSALVTVLFGLALLFAPSSVLRLLRLQPHPDRPGAVGTARATMAGFFLGLGLCCILLAQPLLYMALGISWAFTAFGRLISILSDRGAIVYNGVAFIIEAALALGALLFSLGLIP